MRDKQMILNMLRGMAERRDGKRRQNVGSTDLVIKEQYHLDLMVDAGLVIHVGVDSGRNVYRITYQGYDFLEDYAGT